MATLGKSHREVVEEIDNNPTHLAFGVATNEKHAHIDLLQLICMLMSLNGDYIGLQSAVPGAAMAREIAEGALESDSVSDRDIQAEYRKAVTELFAQLTSFFNAENEEARAKSKADLDRFMEEIFKDTLEAAGEGNGVEKHHEVLTEGDVKVLHEMGLHSLALMLNDVHEENHADHLENLDHLDPDQRKQVLKIVVSAAVKVLVQQAASKHRDSHYETVLANIQKLTAVLTAWNSSAPHYEAKQAVTHPKLAIAFSSSVMKAYHSNDASSAPSSSV